MMRNEHHRAVVVKPDYSSRECLVRFRGHGGKSQTMPAIKPGGVVIRKGMHGVAKYFTTSTYGLWYFTPDRGE